MVLVQLSLFHAGCHRPVTGACRLVAVLDRVQGGRLGAALSSFGITGLYITFVFTIGRFLRLGIQDARTRILYEDLPTTKRLAILCQVRHADCVRRSTAMC